MRRDAGETLPVEPKTRQDRNPVFAFRHFWQRVAEAHSLYGIYHVQVVPSLDNLMVEYDATRLRPGEVELALTGAGIPVERV